jgi:hypothetical protein
VFLLSVGQREYQKEEEGGILTTCGVFKDGFQVSTCGCLLLPAIIIIVDAMASGRRVTVVI